MARDDRGFDDFDARMQKLRAGARRDEQDEAGARADRSGMGGRGLQAGIELVAGVIGGGLIGYLLDRWLETWPLLFVAMFFLGAAAGMLNAYRHIRRAAEPPDKGSRPK